jgi:hypothetical protein
MVYKIKKLLIKRSARELVGWIGSICFMLSGLPTAVDSIINKQCTLPLGTLILWSVGEACLIYYVLPSRDKPLLANYFLNVIFLIPMWYYKF